MPSRILSLGLDLSRRSTQSADAKPSSNISAYAVSDSRRYSMDHIKRPTLPGLGKKHGSDKDKDKRKSVSHDRSLSKDKHGKDPRPSSSQQQQQQQQHQQQKPVTLALAVESPPALFLDSPQLSSGYLLSGRLQVTPTAKDVVLDSIAMYLEATVSTKRPVADRCRECASQVKDLYEWHFLSHPKTFALARATQELPFSHLIPGHLPATTHGRIGCLDYSLHVRARCSDGVEAEFRRDLVVHRALRPTADKNSVRVFPPTSLSLHVTLPSVVHPIGGFPVHCRMTGIATTKDDIHSRWRLRKLSWRVEEHETMVSPACPRHAAKVGGPGKGLQSESKRDIGKDELRGPFKTDLSDGVVEGEFEAVLDASAQPQSDVESPSGLKITHCLVLELVIAEEWAPIRRLQNATPTGAARVLRTQFQLSLTQRQGMGISWDDEMPPMYEDVPDSPPHYKNQATRIEEYEGDDLHADVNNLQL